MTGLSLVVGVLIWTIPAILLQRFYLHWWDYLGQKTECVFDVIWPRIICLMSNFALFAVFARNGGVFGSPRRALQMGNILAVSCLKLAWVPQWWPPKRRCLFTDSPIARNRWQEHLCLHLFLSKVRLLCNATRMCVKVR